MRSLLTLFALLVLAAFLVAGCTPKAEADTGTQGSSSVTDDKGVTTPGQTPAGDDGGAVDNDDDGTEDADEPGDDDAKDDDDKTTGASTSGMKLAVYKNAEGKITCPVMDVAIDSESAAVGFADHNGKRYYFCCDGCPKVFEKNKDKYAK